MDFASFWGFCRWIRDGEDRRGLEDNVYTLCYPEVVSPGRYDATLVGHSSHRTLASLSAPTTCISFRDYIAQTGMRVCAFGYSLLV